MGRGLRDGRPHEVILAVAKERQVDMIVMGTAGHTGLAQELLLDVLATLGEIRHDLAFGPQGGLVGLGGGDGGDGVQGAGVHTRIFQ